MAKLSGPIGVLDSGVGGLTIVRELQRILPGEDIIYFGDSANCPYGNKSSEELITLGKNMLSFLSDNDVKMTAFGCNTLSSMIENFIPCFDHKLSSVIAPIAAHITESGLKEVGLIATEFTVSRGGYQKLIHSCDHSIDVVAKGSPLLAALVDRGDFNDAEIDAEIRRQIDDILSRKKVKDVILGCTHYPIVIENFKRCYPDINFIDPAVYQAHAVRDYLASQDNSFNQKQRGSFVVCTSGDPQIYANASKLLGLFQPDEIKVVKI